MPVTKRLLETTIRVPVEGLAPVEVHVAVDLESRSEVEALDLGATRALRVVTTAEREGTPPHRTTSSALKISLD